ncbi:MAG: hypothetical protein A2Y17_12740 [Clostridiales bacterium GWF2_38_85]|nr:MAG: hypothetical protein A2Y17_12740 [Clostridiales bacterium GWF2_38_85]
MKTAGLAVARRMLDENPKKVCVVCGSGNNGGDGYVAAVYLSADGVDVSVVMSGEPKTEDARYFFEKYKSKGGKLADVTEIAASTEVDAATHIIDAIFGYGFHGEPKGSQIKLIRAVNQSNAFVLSVDIPSGCESDTAEFTEAVDADVTLALGYLKAANVSYPAYGKCGRVELADLGFPKRIDEIAYDNRFITLLNDSTVLPLLPKREDNSHKGSFGTLALYCGSENMVGAAKLAAVAALKSGVGLVKLINDEKTLNYLKQSLSEPVFEYISEAPAKATACVVGCGFGRARDALLAKLLSAIKIPLCIDADGINFVADNIYILKSISADNIVTKVVLTPHPTEMARLTGKTTEYIQSHRLEVAGRFAQEQRVVLVLKGARTVVATPDRLYVNTGGSAALAKGGSGDVLSGMIGAYLTQGMSAENAAVTAVYLHGKAGDRQSEIVGMDSVMPSELL